MPELPEVETIARVLKNGRGDSPGLVGHNIIKADVNWPRIIEVPSARRFKEEVRGLTIEDVSRRGKYIVFNLSEKTMLIHLRMSGDIRVGKSDQNLGDHIRMALYLNKDYQMAFNNPRKFGRVWLVDDPELVVGKLGPEPLEEKLTSNLFFDRLQSKKRQIKPLLMDQHFIAGIGNIYADEALHLAKIHPLTRSNQISRKQAEYLLEAIRVVLKDGIKRNGSSIDWVYQGGDYQNHFRVYQRAGEPCAVCKTSISRIVVGQRGTHFCSTCQSSSA